MCFFLSSKCLRFFSYWGYGKSRTWGNKKVPSSYSSLSQFNRITKLLFPPQYHSGIQATYPHFLQLRYHLLSTYFVQGTWRKRYVDNPQNVHCLFLEETKPK